MADPTPFTIPIANGPSGGGSGGTMASTNSSTDAQNSHNKQRPEYVPRPKRIACVVCRKRKLRCDGTKPSCGNCSRLGHDCAYNEVRKKSGPKRGYVKQLEARLAQVETLLKGHEPADAPRNPPAKEENLYQNPFPTSIPQNGFPNISTTQNQMESEPNIPLDCFGDIPDTAGLADSNIDCSGADIPWEMIGLGLEEPLPNPDVVDELNEIYFQKVYASLPIIHRPRYYAAMNLAPSMRPPICLRYIMWAHAASVTNKYVSLHPHFYQRARKYIQLDQMKGLGEGAISVAHAQCWSLISCYEFRMMHFPRAWMSTGSAMRLCLMMGLHRQDCFGLDMKQCLPAARDWTEREERRRTFWAAFCQDRYASVGTGWPMILDERDILTNLPSSEEAFLNCKAQQTPSLSGVLSGQGASALSPYAGVILLACLFGRNLHHLHRVTANDKDHDLNGEFWKRHRSLDNILLHTSLSLPGHLRLPDGLDDPLIVFCNMCIHTSTICLHQAAIFKAEKNGMPSEISAESKRRCIIAADQITNIMKMISHTDLSTIHSFFSFCLYVASRVFIQYLKSRTQDQAVRSSLQFLLSAMNAIKSKIPLTESFLAALDVDIEEAGVLREDGTSRVGGLESNNNKFQKPSASCSSIINPQCFEQDSGSTSPTLNQSSDSAPGGSFTQLPSRSLPDRSNPFSQQSSTQNIGSYDTPAGNIAGPMHHLTIPSLDNDRIKSTLEMDVSTEMSTGSEWNHSSSDHPTPNTNRTSSNSSFSPINMDNPSPPRQQQQQPRSTVYNANSSTLFDKNISNNSNPDTSSFSSYYASNSTTAGTSTLGNQNPYAFPSGWNFPQQQQPRHSETNNIPPTPSSSTMEAMLASFDDVTWSQSPNIMNWSDWKNS